MRPAPFLCVLAVACSVLAPRVASACGAHTLRVRGVGEEAGAFAAAAGDEGRLRPRGLGMW